MNLTKFFILVIGFIFFAALFWTEKTNAQDSSSVLRKPLMTRKSARKNGSRAVINRASRRKTKVRAARGGVTGSAGHVGHVGSVGGADTEIIATAPSVAKPAAAPSGGSSSRSSSKKESSPAIKQFEAKLKNIISVKLDLLGLGKTSSSVADLRNKSTRRIMCELKRLPPLAVSSSEYPFHKNPRKFAHVLPAKKTIPGRRLQGHTCAVVSNSGRLTNSHLGRSIDKHDQVVRFNRARTFGFESDVGSKTTLRMMNNNIMAYLHWRTDTSNPLNWAESRNEMILGWESCTAFSKVSKCLKSFALSPGREEGKHWKGNSLWGYVEWKRKNPARHSYFLDPRWLNSMRTFLQRLSPNNLAKDLTPSTGFLGVAFMMHFCNEVHLYEMIPTMKNGQPCHYYPKRKKPYSSDVEVEHNANCSFTQGHQREMEIWTFMKLNKASDYETYKRGHAIIPGLKNLKC